MAITAGEQQSGGEVRDNDGRLIVVGPGGVAIGGGGAGTDPLSDGTPGGALPTKTLWIAGADGAVLRGITVNASGHVLTAVQNFPATQAVSDGGGSLTVDGTVTANAGTGPWPVTDNGGTLSVDDGAGSLTVDGSVSVSNFPGSQPVTGPLTDTQLRASAVPTSLAALPALTASAAVIGKVDQGTAGASAWKVDGSAVTQPVSLAALPTVTEKQDQPAATATTWTSATALNTAVTVNTTGYGTANVSIQVPSTVTAGVITLEVSDDAGTTYYQAGAVRVDNGQQENVVTLASSPGIALNRMYSVSVDAMTQIRARLSTVIVGAGNVLVRVGTVAGGIEPFVAQRTRKVVTYRAVFRAAATPWYLTQATTANAKHQQLTIHHAAAATKTVKLRHLWFSIVGNTVAGIGHVTLYRLTSGTTPATGNPAITPTAASSADAAAEVTCLVKPTTAGTEGALVSHNLGNIGVAAPNTATASLMSPMTDLIEMAPHHDDESKPLEIRAGVLEGYGVSIEISSVTNISLIFIAEFTEEPA